MNNSKLKNLLVVALGATTLALSCTSARELSHRSTNSAPLYQAVEDNETSTTDYQSEPEPDYTTVLSNDDEMNNDDLSGLMLPSDLDQGETEVVSTSDLSLNDLNIEEEVKKVENSNTVTNDQPINNPKATLRTAEPEIAERREVKQNKPSNPASKEHYTVIITTDGDNLDSEQLLTQLEDAIASIKRGEHRDVAVEEEAEVNNDSYEEVYETPMEEEIMDPKEEVELIADQSNEFDQSLEDLLEEEINKAPSPALTARKNTAQSGGLTKLYFGDGKSAIVDEGLLIEWENGVAAEQLGLEADVAMPKWLLQGIEWLTHAPKEEPVRSQTIMPVYRYMKNNGILSDINMTKMTPVQVVEKLRVFVEEVKAAQ